MNKAIRKLYKENRVENKEYFIDDKGNKFHLPLDGELLYNFIRRVLVKIRKDDMNNDDVDFVIAKAVSNPFRGYALLSFSIDSRDDLSEAIGKYKATRKELSDKLAGGE